MSHRFSLDCCTCCARYIDGKFNCRSPLKHSLNSTWRDNVLCTERFQCIAHSSQIRQCWNDTVIAWAQCWC